MKINIDVSALSGAQLSGVGVYVKNLVLALNEISQQNDSLTINPTIKLSRWRSRRVSENHIGLPVQFLSSLNSIFLKGIFHGPDFWIPNHWSQGAVVTVHDVAFLEPGMTSPEFALKRKKLLQATLTNPNLKAVCTVSNYSKQQIVKRFPHLDEKVFVTYPGYEHLISEAVDESSFRGKSYFLYVGNLEVRKNVSRLLRAYEEFLRRSGRKNVKLILVGKPGYGYHKIEETYSQLQYRELVEFKGFVDSEQLSSLYKNALAFVYPSLYEGFGIPLVEAMYQGCPVITSDATSTAEVVGDAALLIRPQSEVDIAQAMLELLKSENRREELKNKGYERYKKFSWEACAQATHEAYKFILR